MFRLLLLVAFQLGSCYGQGGDPSQCLGNLMAAVTPDSEGEVTIANVEAICKIEACAVLGPMFQVACLKDKDGKLCVKELAANPAFQQMFATNQTDDGDDGDDDMDPSQASGAMSWACSDCGKQMMAAMSAAMGNMSDHDDHDDGGRRLLDDHGDHGDDGDDAPMDMEKLCIAVDGEQCAPKFGAFMLVTEKLNKENDTDHDGDDHDGHDHGDEVPELTPELIETLKGDRDAICNPCITAYMENALIPAPQKPLLTGLCAALTPPTAAPTVTSNSVQRSITLGFLISIPFLKELF